MTDNASTNALAKALIKAQGEFGPLKLSKTNPHFKSKYADLAGIMASVGDALRKNGLLLTHGCEVADSGVTITTQLIHADSGESISNSVVMPVDRANAQGVGSAITYGRRYGVSALLAIVADDDDDGNGAAGAPPKQSKKAQSAESKPEPEAAPEIRMEEYSDDDARALELALTKLLRWTNERIPEGKPPWNMKRVKDGVAAKAVLDKRKVDAAYVEEILAKAQEKEA